MLAVYLDDSGSHEGGTTGPSSYYVIAGYLGKVEQWQRFDIEWKGVLARYQLKRFHLADFVNRTKNPKSEYQHINFHDGRTLLDQLTRLIRIRAITNVSGILPMDAYKSIVTDENRGHIGQPYTLTTNIMLMAVRRWARRNNHKEKITFFFEQGTKHRGELEKGFSYALQNPALKDELWLGAQAFLKKGDACGIEAADMLAYELYKEYCDQLRGYTSPRPLLQKLVKSLQDNMMIEADGLEEIISKRIRGAI